MVYLLHMHGGPEDGMIVHALRPYFQMVEPESDKIYRIKGDPDHPDDYVQWVDDNTRRIDLHWQPTPVTKGSEDVDERTDRACP